MRAIASASTMLVAAVLPLTLVACSSGSQQTTAAAGPSAAPAAAASTVADPNNGLLTGTQLKSALAPASLLKPGFAPDAPGTRDTGDGYTPPATADVSTSDCPKLDGTSWIAISGITGVSFAQNDYVDKNSSSELAQEVDVFRGTTATTVLDALGKAAVKCPSFTDAQTSSKVKVAERPTAGLGDGAYTITLTSPGWSGGTTLVAVRVGTAIVTVLSSSSPDNGSATATKVVNHIVGAIKGKV